MQQIHFIVMLFLLSYCLYVSGDCRKGNLKLVQHEILRFKNWANYQELMNEAGWDVSFYVRVNC